MMESKENQTGAGNDKLLKLPHNAGRAIVETSSVNACPVLRTKQFSDFCRERGLSINCERLLRLEHLGLFVPIFRVRTPEKGTPPFYIPVHEGNNWFEKGWAWDTTGIPLAHKVPDHKDPLQEGYYSIFQIGHLHKVLQGLDFQISMDNYLNIDKQELVEKSKISKTLNRLTKWFADPLSMDEHAFSVALLCQFVSNKYFPNAQTDLRTMSMPGGCYSDRWIRVDGSNFKRDLHAMAPHNCRVIPYWYEKAQQWQPQNAEDLFNLTREKLRNAYECLAFAQKFCDPLAKWYQLIQFVSVSERSKLKGDALRAETLRTGAYILRLLYQDLYNKEKLSLPNEIGEDPGRLVPELSVRKDTRRYLELVANFYNLNPQPRFSLFVEGRSEEVTIEKIYKSYYKRHPGEDGIELKDMGGVDNVTGGKKAHYVAILLLLDYLRHHQTLTYVILDNENNAEMLKKAARNRRSIFNTERYVTPPDHIHVWDKAFELDNFSCHEIATALNKRVVDYVKQVNGDAERVKRDAERAQEDAERVQEDAERAEEHAKLEEEHAKLMESFAKWEMGHAKWEKGHAKGAKEHAGQAKYHAGKAKIHAKLTEDHVKWMKGHTEFTEAEVKACKTENNPGSCLQKLYKDRVGDDLDKVKLSEILVENMMLPNSPRRIEERPIIKILEEVRRLAARNPFPISEEHSEVNQDSELLGEKYKSKRSGKKRKPKTK